MKRVIAASVVVGALITAGCSGGTDPKQSAKISQCMSNNWRGGQQNSYAYCKSVWGE